MYTDVGDRMIAPLRLCSDEDPQNPFTYLEANIYLGGKS